MKIWDRLPAIVRALIASFLVLTIGQLPFGAMISANLAVSPGVPWASAVMALFLWLYWCYLNGWGWPRSTSAARHESLRAGSMSPDTWRLALMAGGAAIVSLRALTDLCRRLSNRPGADLISADKLSALPWWTVLAFMLTMAAIAGIVEEAAFRGYLQAPLEKRYGIKTAVAITAAVFGLAHYRFGAPDPIPWLLFLPAYVGGSVAMGALAYLTGSIVPGIFLHALFDAVALIQYWLLGIPKSVWEVGTDAGFWIRVVVVVILAVLAIPAYRRLAAATAAAPGPQEAAP